MASVQLKRKGFRAFYKTKKLVINAPAPEGECIYDNCGQVIGRRINFSWDIQGREECFGIMKTIQRLSVSAINYVGNTDVSQLTADTLQGLPSLTNPSKSVTYFGNLPQNGISTRTVTSPDTLSDECNTVHGGDTDETYERFIYTEDCIYTPAFQYSVKHAADSSVTPAELGANITAMGGVYMSAIAEAVECNDIDNQIQTIWGALTTNPITIALGDYE